MDIASAIRARKSIRAFKPDPVSKETLSRILEQALRAPSWANTQPWEFAVVTGRQLEEIREGFLERSLFKFVNLLNPFLVVKIASDPVKRIGGIGDQTTPIQGFGDPVDQTLLRIYGVDVENHG